MAKTTAKTTTQAPKGAATNQKEIVQTNNESSTQTEEVLPPPVNKDVQSSENEQQPDNPDGNQSLVSDTQTQPADSGGNTDTTDEDLNKSIQQAIDENRMFLICSIPDRFFRCGMMFTKEGEVHELTEEQVQIISKEPNLKMFPVAGIQE
ncbi:hypothetical protein [Neisseria sp. Ec49-e6-T10]|uniref:hypothetical protein n=1 Tax=Neisseria sp. Ec49-e6-T10 TaxID=3140744 RepID=UPI003EBEC498